MRNQYNDHKRWADILTQFATGLQNLEAFRMRNIDFEEGNLEPLDERGTAGTKNIHDYADFETLLNENHHVLFLRVAGGAEWIYVSQDEYDWKSKRDWRVDNEALEVWERVVKDRLMIMGKRYVGHVGPRPKPT